jgi:tRNA A37 threonylcarbamoyltransferase TsaD
MIGQIKKQYSPSTYTEGSYSIPVSGLANNENLGIKRGKFNMHPSDMKAIFEPIVKQIIKLVKDQIKATNMKIKAVLLVGGFGQNNYLKEEMRSALSSKIEIMQPPHAWTAVVRGAVMKGLANYDTKLATVNIGPRTARKHYGILQHLKYDASKHSEATK